jgi:hypothetical protein
MVTAVDQASNPIAEADKESVDRLFNKDPQFLTENDMMVMIEKLRANRGHWLKKESAPKAPRGKTKLSEDAVKALLKDLNL